jgi:hypothetical protein
MSEEIRLCKDCKYLNSHMDIIFTCNHPEVSNKRSLVDGTIIHETCSVARLPSWGVCGPDAKLFEPKPLKKRRWFF